MTITPAPSVQSAAHRHRGVATGIAAAVALALSASGPMAQDKAGGAKPAALPGGASSLTESFENWQVSCAAPGGTATCTVSQTQVQKDGRRVLDIRFMSPAPKGAPGGWLSLPFGLELAAGVVFQIDEDKPSAPQAFKTCLPTGCVVPLDLAGPLLAGLRKGTTLKLKATSTDGQAVPLTIQLGGFAQAIDRAAAVAAAK
jgi:invasion protein IalB